MSLINVTLKTIGEADDEPEIIPSDESDGESEVVPSSDTNGETNQLPQTNPVATKEGTSITVPNTGAFQLESLTHFSPLLISGIVIVAIIALPLIIKCLKNGHKSFSKNNGFNINSGKRKFFVGLVVFLSLFSLYGIIRSGASEINSTNATSNNSIAIDTSDVKINITREQNESVYGYTASRVTVADGTNNGYTLGMYASGADIVSQEGDTGKITNTVSSNAALEPDTWGISLSTPVDQNSEVWNPVPITQNNALILKSTDSSTPSSDTTTVYYGAYLSSDLPDGVYSGVTINYFAVANVVVPDSFTLSFNANNGTDAPNTQSCTTVDAGTTCSVVIPSTLPTRSGYTFLGWADTNSATTANYQPGDSVVLSANKIVYAIWSENKTTFTLSFNANGGSNAPATQSCTARGTDASCSVNISSNQPGYSGYDFLGWADEASAVAANYNAGETIELNENKTVYAVWKEISTTSTFTLSFDPNGGSNAPATQSCTTTATSCSVTISSDNPTRSNYTFIGWATTASATAAEYSGTDIDITLTKNITIYAVWKNNYKIRFNGNGSTDGSMSDLTMLYGTAKKLTANSFIRTGYEFTGWNTKADGTGDSYADKQSVNNLTDVAGGIINFYAQWEEQSTQDIDRIHFMNTDGSNAFLIESNGHYGLIDASNPLYPKNPSDPTTCMSDATCRSDSSQTVQHVVEYLRAIGVEKLDFIVASHSHSDHIGGMPYIAAQGFVDSNTKYYYREYTATHEDTKNPDWYNQDFYSRSVEAMRNAGATLVEVTDSEPTFQLGDFALQLFNTEPAGGSELNSSGLSWGENYNSIVILASIGNKKILFASDMEEPDEAKIAAKVGAVDILQMGHHGLASSSSIPYLEVIKPKTVIIPSSDLTAKWRQWGGMAYAFVNYQTDFYLTGLTSDAIITTFENNNYTIKDYNSDTTTTKLGLSTEDSDKGKWIRYDFGGHIFWSHMLADGTMSAGWDKLRYRDDVSWYYFNQEYGNIMEFNKWLELEYRNKMQWFYVDYSGKMATGIVQIGNETFTFDSEGVCISGSGCPHV